MESITNEVKAKLMLRNHYYVERIEQQEKFTAELNECMDAGAKLGEPINRAKTINDISGNYMESTKTILRYKGYDFNIGKQYSDHLRINIDNEWLDYKYVTDHKQREIRAKHEVNKMKKLNRTRLIKILDANIAEYTELVELNNEYLKKYSDFLKSVEIAGMHITSINSSDVLFRGQKIKNGIKYTFTMEQGGYINERITLDIWESNTDLEMFNQLADNKLSVKKNTFNS